MTPKKNPGGWQAGPGQDGAECLKNTKLWLSRQAVKIALPWIATIVTTTRFTAGKSCFLDRLMVLAEGGRHDI